MKPMNRASSTFGTLGFVLCGLLAFEIHAALGTNEISRPVYGSPPQAQASGSESNTPPAPAAIQAWTATTNARPLFNPSRLPPQVAARGAQHLQLPRLSAIMISSNEKIAVFSPSDGKPIIVTKGTHLGAYVVQAINGDSVTVDGPGGVSVLHTGFSNHGASSDVTVDQTALPGGIVLDQIKVPLPDAAHWPGPPSILGEK